MPTYSLTLRSEKGSKLTLQELDDNFLYVLENASGGSGSQGPQGPIGPQGGIGPQGPSGGGVSGSIEVISITISAAELTPSFTTPVEVIPAPGVGKMSVPIWGRFRMINGTTTWGEKYFNIYPNGVNFNFKDSAYLKSALLDTSGKFFSISNADQSQDSDYDFPENESWVLSVGNDYVNTSLVIQSLTAAFEVGDTISSSGVTASVVTALPIDKGQQIIYVQNIIGSFSTSESVSGQPSGASGTINKIDESATPGDYDMELYLGYQTFDLL